MDPLSRIEGALAGLGAELKPPAGWETRVLDVVRPPLRWPYFAAITIVAAAVIIAAIMLHHDEPKPFRLDVTIEKGPTVWRAGGR